MSNLSFVTQLPEKSQSGVNPRTGIHYSEAVAIFICTHACDLSENPGKMGRIGIADHLSDVADPKARVCQQLFCGPDTAVIEEIIKILLCIPVEKFGEVPL